MHQKKLTHDKKEPKTITIGMNGQRVNQICFVCLAHFSEIEIEFSAGAAAAGTTALLG